jgi:DNA-binding SARP family transcriptional activator
LVEKEDWAAAKPMLQSLLDLCPQAVGACELLAKTHHALGETNAEQETLEQLAQRDDSATEAYARLMELARNAQDWPAVILNARRYRAVNPLVPLPYRFLADAGAKAGDARASIEACRALLQLDPADPAELHYRLARLLKDAGDPSARKQVLLALEEAPRYRDALRLLLELHKEETASVPPASEATAQP